MGRKFAYFSSAVLAAVLGLVLQLSFTSYAGRAQQPSGGHPTPECVQCATDCEIAFEECKATNGEAKSAFGQCARRLEQCAAACRKPGGACNPQTEPGGTR